MSWILLSLSGERNLVVDRSDRPYRRKRQLKKEAFKKWQQSTDDEDKEVYKVSKNEYKKAVLLRRKKHVQNYTKSQTLQKEIR